MSSELDKDQLARLGPQVRPSPEVPHLPGFRLAGYFFAFVGGVMWTANGLRPPVLLEYFLIWLLPAILLAAYGGAKFFREMWITNWKPALHERGIVLRRAGRVQAFGFNEVKEISIDERDIFTGQDFYARQWDVKLWPEGDPVTFRLRSLDGHRDEAGEFLDELRTALAGAASRRLRRGEALKGRTWQLTEEGFKSGRLEVPLSEIAGAGHFGGGRVGLWKLAEERPFFTVSARSANVMVLHDVLASRLPSHSLGLGRLQFEKRAWLAHGFRCYEHGLVKYNWFGRKEIQFAEAGGIAYSVQEFRIKAFLLFRRFNLELHRRQGGEPFRVSFLKRRAGDRDFEGLRDRLAERLAGEAAEVMEREGELLWGNGVWLTPEGLRYTTHKPNGGAESGFLHYAQGVLYKFDGGDLFLYRKGDGNRSITHLLTDVPNFYVGLSLLERLASEARGARERGEGG